MGVSRQGRVQRPARTSGRLGDRRSSSHALRVSQAWLARHERAGIAGADSRTGSRPVPGAPRTILPRCAGFTGGTRISWEPGGNSRGPPPGSWTKTRGPAPAGTALCGDASTPSRLRPTRRRFLPRLGASPRHSPCCVGASVRLGRTTSASSHGLRDAPAKRACRGRLVPSRHKDRVVSHAGLPLPPRTCASAAHNRRPTGGAAPAATRGQVPLLRISHTLRVPGGSRASRWRVGNTPGPA